MPAFLAQGDRLQEVEPDRIPAARLRHDEITKLSLVALIQIMVQTPRLMDFAIDRLRTRATVAKELGNVLGDLQPARLDLIWRLIGP